MFLVEGRGEFSSVFPGHPSIARDTLRYRGRGAAAVVFRPSKLSEARFAFHDIQKRHSNSKPSPRSLSENAVSFRSAVFRSAMQRGLLFTGPFVLFMTVESHFTLLNRATSEMMSQAEKAGKKKEKTV